ncbi:MAG: hypothetical protein QW767_01400 [Thermoprotei archaeon]
MHEFGYSLHSLTQNALVADGVHLMRFSALSDSLQAAEPGSYVMLHVPRVGDVPLSIYDQKEREVLFLVSDYGGPSTSLVKMREGSKVGIRGPLGNRFPFSPDESYLFVAGGVGAAPLIFFSKKYSAQFKQPPLFVAGARDSSKMFAPRLLGGLNVVLLTVTDDGSYGIKGDAASLAEKVVAESEVTAVYACGPEPMLRKLLHMCTERRLDFYGSFVRDVRCGFGICGSCVMEDTGLLLCVDGPIFSKNDLQPLR